MSIAKGFGAMVAVILAFNCVALLKAGDAWLGILYLLILLFPLSSVLFLRFRRPRLTVADSTEKLSHVLFALQGVALACWAFDLATTFYAIDVARVATEINPLGWPFGALGAFAYYGPTVALSYVLLFRMRQKVSVFAAIPMTTVMLLMGSMNLNAGIGNYGFFLSTASLAAEIRFSLLVVVLAANVVYALLLARVGGRLFPAGRA
ncbi:MAG: hypothetical protein ACE14S_12040 [Candidatus Bathyarchaeia archaeon]